MIYESLLWKLKLIGVTNKGEHLSFFLPFGLKRYARRVEAVLPREICFKEVSLKFYRWLPLERLWLNVTTADLVRNWSPWSPWSYRHAFFRQERRRICCSENCPGAPMQRREKEKDCVRNQQAENKYKRISATYNFFLDDKVEVNGTCVYSFFGATRQLYEMKEICDQMGLDLYTVTDPLFTRTVMELLYNGSEQVDPGPNTAFMRTPDSYFSIVSDQTFTTSDLIDGDNIHYFGRMDLKPKSQDNDAYYSYIHHCVTLSFVRWKETESVDEVPYDGVGIGVRNCKNERFLCHDRMPLRRKSRSTKVEENECQEDHLGYTYKGNVSTSASGLHCIPWNTAQEIQTHRPDFFYDRPNVTWNSAVLIRDRIQSSRAYMRLAVKRVNSKAHANHLPEYVGPKTPSGVFLPPNLFGDGNQCRNSPHWPFQVADPICLVKHRSGRPVFDLCAVPLCERKGQKKGNLPPEATRKMPYTCETKFGCTLYVGPYRDFTFYRRDLIEADLCSAKFTIYMFAFIVTGLSILLHSGSLFVISKLSLWNQRKYLQLFLLNFTSIFSGIIFLIVSGLFHFLVKELLLCVSGFQLLNLSICWNFFSLISLGIDCLVAVYRPLEFQSIMTTGQFFKFNAAILVYVLVFYVVPIPIFGTQNDGFLTVFCDYTSVVPTWYLLSGIALAALLLLTLMVVNISILVGVIIALVNQKKLGVKSKSITSKMLKLSLRLLMIIAVNLLCNLSFILQAFDIKITTHSGSMLVTVSNGVLNILLFAISDPEFRENIKKAFK